MSTLRRRLIVGLLDALHAEGYPLGPGKLMQVETLLQQIPEDTTPEDLSRLLAPLFASSPESQKHFYALFDKHLKALKATEAGGEKQDAGVASERARETPPRRYLLVILLLLCGFTGFIFDPQYWPSWFAIAAAVIAAVIATRKLIPKPKIAVAYLFAIFLLVAAGIFTKGKWFRPEVVVEFKGPMVERFTVFPGATQERSVEILPGDAENLTTLQTCSGQTSGETASGARFSLDSRGTLQYTAAADATPGTSDSLCVEAVYTGRTDTIYFFADILEAPVAETTPNQRFLSEVELPFPRDIKALEIDPEKQARAEFYRRYHLLVRTALILLIGLALWAFGVWYGRRRARFVAEVEQSDRPPYVWNIETGDTPPIAFEDAFVMLLNRLRRREGAESHRIDISATVKATVRRGGRPELVFRQQTRPPEYLLLIDRFSTNDHRAQLFDTFYLELRRVEVPIERYFFHGEPRVCFNEAHPDGQMLSELLHRHRDARLLLVGEGERLLSPSTGKLAGWTRIFSGWRRRALLLHRPNQAWGRREQVLGSLFTLAPASMQGLDMVLDQFETLEQRNIADILRRAGDTRGEPFEFKGSLLGSLRRHQFSEPLIRWVAACAVYPALNWHLTLHLGRLISELEDTMLLTEANIRRLTRLPWFVQGIMPESARETLINYLAEHNLETTVRKAIDELLRSAPAPEKGSVAWDDYRMNFILNELMLKPDPAKQRALEKEFERFLAAGRQPDFVSFKLLTREPTRLDLIVPDRWKKYRFRHASSRFGFRSLPILLPAFALAALAIVLAPLPTDTCSGETVNYHDRQLCIDNADARLLYLEMISADAIEARQLPLADSLRAEAGRVARSTIPAADTVPFYRNTATHYYNAGVRYFNCSLNGASGCATAEADSLLDLACSHFRMGDSLHTMISGAQDIKYYNAMRSACLKNIPLTAEARFTLRGRIRDDRSGQPLSGAVLRAGDAATTAEQALRNNEAAPFQARTNTRGIYTLENVPATVETLLLYVAAPGYMPQVLRLRPQAELPTIRLQPDVQPEPDDKDGKAWQEALALNTVEGYKRYQRQFPQGQYLQMADAKIFGLEVGAAFDAAVAANTIAAYNAFLQGPYRDSDLAGEVRRRRDILQEAADYRAASTPEELRAFLEKWPNGANAAAAKKRLETPPASLPDPIKKLEADMVRITGGSFTMGCKDEKRDGDCYDREKPARTVQVAAFSIGRYEVTQAQWRAVMGSDPPNLAFKGCDNCPVENVSWNDIQEFLQKLNALTGKKYRLPSEAEWEYAARGGNQSREYLYSGSNDANEVAWYDDNSGSKTHPVGQKKPNELGLYDMSGNVWEWCADDWHNTYQGAPADSRPWVDRPRGGSRVLRGGSWLLNTGLLRAANRSRYTPDYRYDNIGFRLARD